MLRKGGNLLTDSKSTVAASLPNQRHRAVQLTSKASEQHRYAECCDARIVENFVDEQFELLGTRLTATAFRLSMSVTAITAPY